MTEAYIRGVDRMQSLLLPACVEDYVGENNLARAVDAFVESMRWGQQESCLPEPRQMDGDGGRPGYSPKTLGKLFIWGYLNKVRSTRGLEREAQRNLELIWLLGDLRPDHSSISRFRDAHRKRIKCWLKEFNLTCARLGLIRGEEIAVDSVRLKAVNSKRNTYTQEQLKERLVKLNAKIDGYLDSLEQSDQESEDGSAPGEVAAKLKQLDEAKAIVQQMLWAAEQSPTGQLSTVDPDARLLGRSNGRTMVGYLAQSAVDSTAHLIAAVEVTQASSDHGQLTPMVQAACEVIPAPAPVPEASAEQQGSEQVTGHEELITVPEVAQASSDRGQLTPVVQAVKEEPVAPRMRVLADTGYFEISDLARCEKEGFEVYVAVGDKEQSKKGLLPLSSFHYDAEADCYRCQQGQELARHEDYTKGEAIYQSYYNTEACRSCPMREQCTKGKYRKVHRHAQEATVEGIRQRMKANPEVYPRRKATVEHPFGSMMFWNEGRNLLCRGLEKANAEFSLSALAYNLKRAAKVVGVKALVAAFRRFLASIRRCWWRKSAHQFDEHLFRASWLQFSP